MIDLDRRRLLRFSAQAAMVGLMAGTLRTPAGAQSVPAGRGSSVEQWMQDWMTHTRAPGATLHVSRFVEPIYFLTQPISWRPNPDQVGKFEAVDVPTGFVTDFASVPRPFWTLLRPDGDYAYAAIVHDYLYWMQNRPREVADQIFKFGMQDFNIDNRVIAIIYAAVRSGGGSSWKRIAAMKTRGEKRILKQIPHDPRIKWQDWKRRDVFASQD